MARTSPVFSQIKTNEPINIGASYAGVSMKTIALFAIAIVSGILSVLFLEEIASSPVPLLICGILGFVCVWIGTRSPSLAMPCSIIYAITEGVFLGILTLFADTLYPGIAGVAVLITAIIFGIMLMLYSTGVIKVTTRLRRFMYTTLISLVLVSLVLFVLSFFDATRPIVQIFYGEYSPFAIIFSIALIIFAAIMLTIDFDNIRNLVDHGFDKSYEWSAALGLMVTVVWIYVEVIRLLVLILARRD